ncbi:MAG: SMI1/KNR4 family protein [Clostridium sp.]
MNKFWDDFKDDTICLPDISIKEIEKIENKLGKKLPKTYKKIILEQNGGYIEFNAVPVSDENIEEDFLLIDSIWGLGKNGLLDSEYLISEWDLPKNILIFSGDGNYWYAMDYKEKPEDPSVIYIQQDAEKVINVASNFNEFLNMLFVKEFEYDMGNKWTKEEALDILSGNDELLIDEVLVSFQNITPKECEWLLPKLLELTQHKSVIVRRSIFAVIMGLQYSFEDISKEYQSIVKEIIERSLQDEDLEVVSYAEEYKELFFEK